GSGLLDPHFQQRADISCCRRERRCPSSSGKGSLADRAAKPSGGCSANAEGPGKRSALQAQASLHLLMEEHHLGSVPQAKPSPTTASPPAGNWARADRSRISQNG